jgi:UDPglucose 6-dehydrogenase
MGLDPRIGKKFLRAGAGWGGSCFPKDVKALTSFSRSLNYEPSILKAALEVNERQALHVVELAKGETGSLKGKSVAVLGLAFKPGTDDVREAPSIKIIKELISQGAKVTAYDPVAMENAKKVLGGEIEYAPSAQECLRNADCCILVTEWNEFKRIKPKTFIETMRTPILIDSRRMYNPEKYSKGIKYRGIGLGR